MEDDMSQTQAREQHSFKAEVQKLLHIITHSIYTNKEIFLRELVSNASDALDKLRFEVSRSTVVADPDLPLEIRITADKDAKKLIIEDTGVGMTRDELIDNIGTIAKSGSEEFLRNFEQAKGEGKNGESADAGGIIGRFGVGFYSVFMVADKVVITTRSFQPDAKPVLWESDGLGSFEISELEESRPPWYAHRGHPAGGRCRVPGKGQAGAHPQDPFEFHRLPHPVGGGEGQHHHRAVARAQVPDQAGAVRGVLQVPHL